MLTRANVSVAATDYDLCANDWRALPPLKQEAFVAVQVAVDRGRWEAGKQAMLLLAVLVEAACDSDSAPGAYSPCSMAVNIGPDYAFWSHMRLPCRQPSFRTVLLNV